jgi:hypothetical protein
MQARRPAPPATARAAQASVGGRLTAQQKLAQQKKEKRGVKARKELLTDEATLRQEYETARDEEYMAMVEAQEAEHDRTKDRLIRRLTQNLEDLRLSAFRQQSAADASLAAIGDGLLKLCAELTHDGIVSSTIPDLLQRDESGQVLGPAIAALGQSVANCLRDNDASARRAEREAAIMAEQLRETKLQLCASENIIASRHVAATTEYLSAAELYRQQGAEFEDRMAALERERRAAFESIIRQAAEPKYHLYGGLASDGRKPSCLDGHPADDIMHRYLTQTERALVAQSNLLLDLQHKIAQLTAQHLQRCGDRLRRDRHNLPSDVHEMICCSEYTKDDLLAILKYVSFEPRVSESVAALVRTRHESESAECGVLPQAPYDILTGAAQAAALPTALAILPPRPSKMESARVSLVDAAARLQPGFGGPRPPAIDQIRHLPRYVNGAV